MESYAMYFAVNCRLIVLNYPPPVISQKLKPKCHVIYSLPCYFSAKNIHVTINYSTAEQADVLVTIKFAKNNLL